MLIGWITILSAILGIFLTVGSLYVKEEKTSRK